MFSTCHMHMQAMLPGLLLYVGLSVSLNHNMKCRFMASFTFLSFSFEVACLERVNVLFLFFSSPKKCEVCYSLELV